MAFCFSGSLMRANFSIVLCFVARLRYCSCQINFSFFLLSSEREQKREIP